jgi:hypothetical protein
MKHRPQAGVELESVKQRGRRVSDNYFGRSTGWLSLGTPAERRESEGYEGTSPPLMLHTVFAILTTSPLRTRKRTTVIGLKTSAPTISDAS